MVAEWRAMDIIYFYFSEVSNTVSLNILLDDLMKCRLAKQTVKQIENCLKSQA